MIVLGQLHQARLGRGEFLCRRGRTHGVQHLIHAQIQQALLLQTQRSDFLLHSTVVTHRPP